MPDSRPVRRTVPVLGGVLLLLILTAFWAGLGATAALAAPSEPTMDLVELDAKLDASGTAPGYLKTVLSGSDIETIPLTALSIVPNVLPGGYSLIMFEASGSAINDAGGVAAGMSGSPVYVDDSGTDKLIGALSYGDWYTLGGLALATPIEYMSQQESDHPLAPPLWTRTAELDYPADTTVGPIDKVVIEPQADLSGSSQPAPGVTVMRPLAMVSLSGLQAGSRAHRGFAQRMAARGLSVLPDSGVVAAGYDPSFETTLAAGSAAGALFSRGDFWAGTVGTVTYSSAGSVMAFGHPFMGSGTSEYALTNAWVHGIWGSSVQPYKIASPAKLRGSFTQDRLFGVGGRTDIMPSEVAIDSRVTHAGTGADATSTSWMSSRAMDDPYIAELSAFAPYVAIDRARDEDGPFTAESTTTIRIGDGTATHTATLTNVWGDVEGSTGDLFNLTTALEPVYEWGLQKPTYGPIDFEANITTIPAGTIVDLSVPEGLKRGANKVTVSMLVYGEPDTRTVEATVTIPSGVSLLGRLAAFAPPSRYPWFMAYAGDGSMVDFDEFYGLDGAPTSTRPTIAEIMAAQRAMPRHDELQLSYTEEDVEPDLGFEGEDEWFFFSAGRDAGAVQGSAGVDSTASTSLVLKGSASKSSPLMTVRARPTVTRFKQRSLIVGDIEGLTKNATVTVLRKEAGASTYSAIGKVKAPYQWGSSTFVYQTYPLRKNTTFKFVYEGDDSHLAASATRTIWVRANARLTARPSTTRALSRTRLSATFLPSQAGRLVWFERKVGWRWVRMRTVRINGANTAVYYMKVPKGRNRVRVRFLGSSTNASAFSNTVIVRGT